jgi:hypothetical protein
MDRTDLPLTMVGVHHEQTRLAAANSCGAPWIEQIRRYQLLWCIMDRTNQKTPVVVCTMDRPDLPLAMVVVHHEQTRLATANSCGAL